MARNFSPASASAIRLDPTPLLDYLAPYEDYVDLPLPGKFNETGFVQTETMKARHIDQHGAWAKRLAAMVARIKRQGYVSERVADSICCKYLGVHPVFVFGDAWFSVDDENNPLRVKVTVPEAA